MGVDGQLGPPAPLPLSAPYSAGLLGPLLRPSRGTSALKETAAVCQGLDPLSPCPRPLPGTGWSSLRFPTAHPLPVTALVPGRWELFTIGKNLWGLPAWDQVSPLQGASQIEGMSHWSPGSSGITLSRGHELPGRARQRGGPGTVGWRASSSGPSCLPLGSGCPFYTL